MIVDLFLRDRGLPQDWRPYAELSSFSYHFGLHATAATVAALSGVAPHKAVLVVGQLLSAMGVVTAYALAAGLSGRPWVGFVAALAAGGLGPMPAYYVNWGRYTQLAGQVILPAAGLAAASVAAPNSVPGLSVGRHRLRDPGSKTVPTGGEAARRLAVAAILVAGLALTHYIVTLLFAMLVAAWWLVADLEPAAGARMRAVARLAGVAALAAVLALPWAPRFARGAIGTSALRLASEPAVAPAVYGVAPVGWVWDNFDRLVGWPLALAAIAGTAVAVLSARVIDRGNAGEVHDRVAFVGAAWLALIVGAAYPRLVGLPVVGVVKDFAVAIGVYLPAGLAAGGLVDLPALLRRGGIEASSPQPGAQERARSRRQRARAILVTVGMLALALALPWKDRAVVSADNLLVTAHDLDALAWIRMETPAEARFLVSAFPAFGNTVVAGEDAGWWLPYFTGRSATVPPVTTGLESSFRPGYRESMNALSAAWHRDLDGPDTRRALADLGVHFAFVGEIARRNDKLRQGQGLAERLAASPHWRLVHREGEALVYAEVGGEVAP
jgi:hypothetical protein